MFGVLAATLMRARRISRANEQLAVAAMPLMDLRRDVLQLHEDHSRLLGWCQQSEAARPSDDILQSIAAIALASQTGQGDVIVDSLHLRLPHEYSVTAAEPPHWAIPVVSIAARVSEQGKVDKWLDRLNQFARIKLAKVQTESGPLTVPGDAISLQISATPIATRVAP